MDDSIYDTMPTPPMFHIYRETDEKGAIQFVQLKIFDFFHFVKQFIDAVVLFEQIEFQCSKEPKGSRWISFLYVPARDGAMSIYHSEKTLETLRASFKDCPEFRDTIDSKRLRDAQKELQRIFPFATKLRTALAHAGELHSTPEKSKINSISGFSNNRYVVDDTSHIVVSNGLDGRSFQTTFDGQLITYEVSKETAQSLIEITSQVCAAFTEAEFCTLSSKFRDNFITSKVPSTKTE